MTAMLLTVKDGGLRISLKYEGSDVDDGTMPVEDVLTALQGFAGAYGKAANELLPSSTHELRISAIKEGSFELAILAWVGAAQLRPTLEALKSVSDGAKYVFNIVKSVIDAKKFVRSNPFEIKQVGDHNTTVVINMDGVQMPIPPEAVKLLKEKLLDNDLGKITSPLSEGSIDNAKLIASDISGVSEANITSVEKSYFSATEGLHETSQETESAGTLVSLNKESLRGIFKKIDGHKIPYRYTGASPESFYSDFSYKGTVRATCIAYFDESLNLRRLEITKAVRIQTELSFVN
jgi:hypothetical protein